MKRCSAVSTSRFFVLFLSLSLFLLPLPAFAEEAEKPKPKPEPAVAGEVPAVDSYSEAVPEIEIVADQLEYAKDEKKVIAKSNVVLTYEDIKLTADYAEVYSDTREAHAKGHVLIFKGGVLTFEGDQAYFNFKVDSGRFPDGRHFTTPWFVTGDEINQVRKGYIVIKNARITTCDYEHVHYEIRATTATVRRGDKLIAKNVRIYALNKPIFWLPILVIPLNLNSLPFSVSFGHNDQDGYYIETVKGVAISKHLQGKLLVDWRSKRGFGAGGILDYNYGDIAKGNIVGYRTQDKSAPVVTNAENPFATEEERDRGRLTWRHRANLDKYSFLLARYHGVSDEFVLQDFFEKEHRGEIEPHSFVTLTKNTQKWGSLIHVQKRVNDFEALVERLPELRFDWKNQPFFHPDVYYENQFSIVNLGKRFGRSDMNEDVFRMDNFHEWAYPVKWEEIKFTPFVNSRGTFYSRDRVSDERFRFAAGYGFDLRTHFYRTYDVTADWMGVEVNGLRHVLEPSFGLSSIRLNNVSDETLQHFDTIDRIDDKDEFIFGLENRIQTKRVVNGQMRHVDIVSLNTFLNYQVKADEPKSSSQFKTLSQEIVLRPYSWLRYETRINLNVEEGELESLNQDLIAKMNRFRFLLGHRYVKDPNEAAVLFNTERISTSHQFVFEASYKINNLWELHGHVRYDPSEQELEEWQVSATRDLHDFILNIGYSVRNSSIRSGNQEWFFNFTMKQFPVLALRTGGGRATFSEPRIGETVAGANQLSGGPSYFEDARIAAPATY